MARPVYFRDAVGIWEAHQAALPARLMPPASWNLVHRFRHLVLAAVALTVEMAGGLAPRNHRVLVPILVVSPVAHLPQVEHFVEWTVLLVWRQRASAQKLLAVLESRDEAAFLVSAEPEALIPMQAALRLRLAALAATETLLAVALRVVWLLLDRAEPASLSRLQLKMVRVQSAEQADATQRQAWTLLEQEVEQSWEWMEIVVQ